MSKKPLTQTAAPASSAAPALSAHRIDVRKMVTLALLAAVAYVIMMVGRIPVILWLSYDPKDVIIAIAGFIYGPLSAFGVSLVVSFIEMITVSDTFLWGLLMNVLSTCAFVCPAAYIYKKNHTMKGAVIGILVGAVVVVPTMLLWNYLVTPFYMGQPREAVVELLIPAFLPFNVLKAVLNGAITILIYKPVVQALRKARLIRESQNPGAAITDKKQYGVILVAAVLFVTGVLFILAFNGII